MAKHLALLILLLACPSLQLFKSWEQLSAHLASLGDSPDIAESVCESRAEFLKGLESRLLAARVDDLAAKSFEEGINSWTDKLRQLDHSVEFEFTDGTYRAGVKMYDLRTDTGLQSFLNELRNWVVFYAQHKHQAVEFRGCLYDSNEWSLGKAFVLYELPNGTLEELLLFFKLKYSHPKHTDMMIQLLDLLKKLQNSGMTHNNLSPQTIRYSIIEIPTGLTFEHDQITLKLSGFEFS